MKNDLKINLQLRSEILDIALNLETSINTLILLLLLIEKPKRKAISSKSGNLSFRNKIDLLFDLDVLISEEHQYLLLVMEFRNQFLHNIECNSFEKAVKLLGFDKEQRLLKFRNEDKITDIEYQYNSSFRNLNIKCLEIVADKLKDRKNLLEDRRKYLVNLIEGQIFFIEQYFDILMKLVDVCNNNVSEIPEVSSLINQIVKTITDDMESIQTSEYAKLQSEFIEPNYEKFKALFGK